MHLLSKVLLLFFGFGSYALGQTGLTQALDKLLMPYYKTDEPGGAILVARNGQILYQKVFGLANMELNVPINDSTIFYIGSNTKQFTAVAILQLVEKGKIQLKDSIGKYISPCPHPVSNITISQLLSHTSGLGSNSENAHRSLECRDVTPAELVHYYTHLPMDFIAGSKWAYNNANFYILGYLIEKLTGKSYSEHITEAIFRPVGMLHTHMGKELSIVKNRACGYTNFRLGIQNAKAPVPGTLYASGGIQSTTGDMLKWNRALHSGLLLKPEISRLLYTQQALSNGKLTSYGMGFHIQELRGSLVLRHGGLIEGFTSETLYLPTEDVYVVIMLNEETSKIPITALARIIGSLTIGKPYNFEKIAIAKNELSKYSGVYENEKGEVVNITQQNESLGFQRPNGTLYYLHYAGEDEFFFEKDYLRTEFIKDSVGKIKSLKFSVVDIGVTEWFKTQRALLKLSPERISDAILKEYSGYYVSKNYDTITISKEGSSLYYKISDQPKQILAAENNKKFYSLKEGSYVEFLKTPATNDLMLLYIQGGRRKKYSKSH